MSELTVPRAPATVGRAAQVDTTPIAGDGGLIAEFGNRMLEKGLQLKAQRDERARKQATLDMTRDMGQARLEVEQIADPAAIGPAWDAKVAEITGRYITEDTPPEVADALRMSVQQLGDEHGLELSGKVINLERSAEEATWVGMRDAIVTEAATADPTTFGALIEIGEAEIDARAAKGLIDPKAAAEQKIALRQEVYENRAATAIDADPEGFLTAAEAGEYDAMGGTNLVKFKGAAQNEIDRRAAAAAKAAEAEAKARSDAIGTRLDAIADLASKGRLVEDEEYLADPDVRAHPKAAKAVAAVELRKEIPHLDMMTVGELDALIQAEAKRPVTETWENERLTVLRDMRDKKETGYSTNPKETATLSGMVAPDLPEFDPADPAGWAKALKANVSFSGYLQEGGYTKRSAIFSPEQKAALKPVLDPKAEAGPKVALMGAILEGTGGNAQPVLAELEADPVFRRGLKVLAVTGDPGLTEAILRGGQKVEAKTTVLPSRKEQILIFDALTGGTFSDAPALKEEIMAASLALYADGADGIDAETTANEGWIADGAAYTLYQQSVQRLLGAQPDRNGALTVGGVQELNGSLVVLPRGVSAEQVEASWDAATYRLRGGKVSENWNEGAGNYDAHWDFSDADTMPDEERWAPFKAASLDRKSIPDLGSDPSGRMAEITLRRVGESDVYEMVWNNNGRLQVIPQKGTDYAWRFRLSDLVRGAGQ